MNKQGLIKHFEEMEYVSVSQMGKKAFIDLIEQLDEPQRVTVPQFVANYIEYTKTNEWNLLEAMANAAYEDDKEIRKWFNNNSENFALAWINGYEVEKEPKYTVKFKATKQYLCNDDLGPHFDPSFRTNFTKSDLEKLDLGWVFDCEGMEVKEVQDDSKI